MKASEPRKRGPRRKMINGEPYLTTGQAAEKLGVCKNTLLKFTRRGKLYSLEIGQCKCFKQEWLDVFVDQMTKKGSLYMEARKK